MGEAETARQLARARTMVDVNFIVNVGVIEAMIF
jgi:hypothetical protein